MIHKLAFDENGNPVINPRTGNQVVIAVPDDHKGDVIIKNPTFTDVPLNSKRS